MRNLRKVVFFQQKKFASGVTSLKYTRSYYKFDQSIFSKMSAPSLRYIVPTIIKLWKPYDVALLFYRNFQNKRVYPIYSLQGHYLVTKINSKTDELQQQNRYKIFQFPCVELDVCLDQYDNKEIRGVQLEHLG